VTTWSIGEAAEKCGLSQHTLRWYERIGLLGAIERGGDGRRRFSDRDLDWLSLLIKLLDAKITHYSSCLSALETLETSNR
jgi:DNA-binding transcriptional MerR regulator